MAFDTTTVLAQADDFTIDEVLTKTTLTQSGNNAPSFAWKAGDVIGVIPMDGKTVQSNYEIASIGTDPKTATFDGGVWALKDGKSYAAYYPFNETIARSGDQLEFSFQGQKQEANNSLSHIGNYDYMYSPAVVSSSSSKTFHFKHLVSLVRLQLTVPQADQYATLSLESSENWFAGKAMLSLSDGTMSATENLNTCSISLNRMWVDSGELLTVWFSVLPTKAISGKTLSVKLVGTHGVSYGKLSIADEWKEGKAYSYTCDLSSVEFIDLGLSVMWAACNLGAASPEEYGDYYSWGATEPLYEFGYAQESPEKHWKAGKSGGYTWVNTPYQTANTTSYLYTKWTKYLGSTNSSYRGASAKDIDVLKTILEPDDDAAHVELGGKWRIPTEADFDELLTYCSSEWTTQNGVNGMKFTSSKNGKSIFLPAAGCRLNTTLYEVGHYGQYWSSSIDSPTTSCMLYFYTGSYGQQNAYDRCYGQSVRPVSE